MNYCSHCGKPNIVWTIPEGDDKKRQVCTNCNEVYYQNPKIIVGCIIIHDGKILLGKRQIEPRAGMWNLPAGFMELEETVENGAIREAREELMAEVEIIKLHSVYSVLHAGQVYIVFLAKLKDGKFGAGHETTDAQLFDLDKIPFEELAFNSNKFAIQKYLENPDYVGVHHGSYFHRPEQSL